jgi:DNA-binding transcriptional ArsR family regulator
MEDRLQSAECAKRLKALADPDRLRIIQYLQGGPKTVGALAELLESPAANVSHHLRVLYHAGVVRDEKQGRRVVYSLQPNVFRPKDRRQLTDALDFGCCCLHLGSARLR